MMTRPHLRVEMAPREEVLPNQVRLKKADIRQHFWSLAAVFHLITDCKLNEVKTVLPL